MKNEEYLYQFKDFNQSAIDYLSYLKNNKESEKTQTVIISLFVRILKNNEALKGLDDLLKIDRLNVLEKVIINLKPKSRQELSQIFSILDAFSVWCEKKFKTNNLKNILFVLDKNLIIRKTQFCRQKYFNNSTYKKILKEIELNEELNSIQYITLLQTIYEGIYDKNLFPLYNLSIDDLDLSKNEIKFTNSNGKLLKKKVSKDLIENMKTLSECNVWFKKNCRGTISSIKIKGKKTSSIFKIEVRKPKNIISLDDETIEDTSIQHVLYRRLRKITKEYFGDTSIQPFQIYISGILYRICNKLEEEGISTNVLFQRNITRNNVVYNIIKKELLESNYCDEDEICESINSFHYKIKGYEHIF